MHDIMSQHFPNLHLMAVGRLLKAHYRCPTNKALTNESKCSHQINIRKLFHRDHKNDNDLNLRLKDFTLLRAVRFVVGTAGAADNLCAL